MKSNTNVLNLLLGNLLSGIFMIMIIISISTFLDDKYSEDKKFCSWKEDILLSFRIPNLFSFDIFILGGFTFLLFNMDKSQRN
jgi:hypothetical protein